MNRIPSPLAGKISQKEVDRRILRRRCLIAAQEEIARAEHDQNILRDGRINSCPFSQLTRKRAETFPRRDFLALALEAQKQSRSAHQDDDQSKPEISPHGCSSGSGTEQDKRLV